jgi:hypothetical protein
MSMYDPNGWRSMTCCICGNTKPHEVYININIATNDPDSQFPFSETNLCKECWNEHGIESAMEHNAQCREDCGCPIGN